MLAIGEIRMLIFSRTIPDSSYGKSGSGYSLGQSRILQNDRDGDTAGIKIHSADCTSTDVRLLPCKLLSTKATESDCQMCKVYTSAGIAQNWFRAEDLEHSA